MKSFFKTSLLGLGMFLGILLGGVFFLFSLLVGSVSQKRWIGYGLGFAFALGLTLVSAIFPELFRFGVVHFRFHDQVFMAGIPPLAANIFSNLLFSGLGVETAWMIKKSLVRQAQENIATRLSH